MTRISRIYAELGVKKIRITEENLYYVVIYIN